MLSTVKLCGVTRTTDALDALAQGVAYIGVNRWPQSPRFVSDANLKALLDVIPAGRRVFVDVEPDTGKLKNAIDAGFDFFQIHFASDSPDARARAAAWEAQTGKHRLWLAPRVAPHTPWPRWVFEHADTLLCDGFHAGKFGGTGLAADWSLFASLKNERPDKRWILAGGLSPTTLAEAAHSGADFFDLNSGVEDAPGVKNAEKLAQALAALLNFEQNR
ncbi:MAG: phosphoribosylanthranilate isomerase [Puniceicoccales bacterium]|nr:phosphoribosylanthranilate isomerase [Puniceicoccales bacterium]